MPGLRQPPSGEERLRGREANGWRGSSPGAGLTRCDRVQHLAQVLLSALEDGEVGADGKQLQVSTGGGRVGHDQDTVTAGPNRPGELRTGAVRQFIIQQNEIESAGYVSAQRLFQGGALSNFV